MNTAIFYCDVEWGVFNRREFIIEFARQHPAWKVVAINRPAAIVPNLFRKKKRQHFFDLGLKESEVDNLYIYRPLTLFHDHIGGYFLKGWGNYFLKNTVRRILRRVGFFCGNENSLLIWLYEQPHWMVAQVKDVKKKVVVWEIFDDYRMSADGAPRNMWIDNEDNMLRTVDNIFVLTERLKEKYLGCGLPVNVIGNGYPKELFYPRRDVSSPYCCDSKPNILYLGVIRNWIDFDLVSSLVCNRKDLNFIFVGPVEADVADRVNDLKRHSNFNHVDYVDRSSVPVYMTHADIGFIPYKVTSFTKSVKPIKLFEFLACGTPVVTTTSADIKTINGAIYCTNNRYEDFSKKIDAAIFEKSSEKCIEISRPWTWGKIVNDISSLLRLK